MLQKLTASGLNAAKSIFKTTKAHRIRRHKQISTTTAQFEWKINFLTSPNNNNQSLHHQKSPFLRLVCNPCMHSRCHNWSAPLKIVRSMNTNVLVVQISTASGMRQARHLKSKPQFATTDREHLDDCEEMQIRDENMN